MTDYYSHTRPEIIAMIPEGCSSVLDIGCGTGAMGKHFKEKGVSEFCGVELLHAAKEKVSPNSVLRTARPMLSKNSRK